MNQKLLMQMEIMEEQMTRMGELLEQKQLEINSLKSKLQSEEIEKDEMKRCLWDLNLEFQKLEQQTKIKVYELNRELYYYQEENKHLKKPKGPEEQYQISSLLRELSEYRLENQRLTKLTKSQSQSFHETHSIRRYSPQMVTMKSFVSQDQKRVPSLPDVASNRHSVNNRKGITAH